MIDFESLANPPAEATPEDKIRRALNTVRTHFGMPVGYLSEIVGDKSVFRVVDAPGLEHMITDGDQRDLNEVYCTHILEGRLPELIPDTADEALCQEMPITSAVPIGSHASVPIRRSDGSVYGMFCCLSPEPTPNLTDRDLSIMKAFASLAADQVNGALEKEEARRRMKAAVETILESGALTIVYQPICSMEMGDIVGVEALSRFDIEPRQGPDKWFALAAEVGMDIELELAAIRRALSLVPELPEGTYMSVNAGPDTVCSGRLREAMADVPLDRVLLEITEHAVVEDGAALIEELSSLRERGLRVAVDDVGAGYSGLAQIIAIAPDVIKLDMSLVRGIDRDAARRALTAAMVHFVNDTGAGLVAEGVETPEERDTLRKLGVGMGQGWHFGRPGPLSALTSSTAAAE